MSSESFLFRGVSSGRVDLSQKILQSGTEWQSNQDSDQTDSIACHIKLTNTSLGGYLCLSAFELEQWRSSISGCCCCGGGRPTLFLYICLESW